MTTTITVNRHRLRLVLAAIALLSLFALMPVDSPPGGAPTIVPNAGSGAAQHQRPALDSLSKPSAPSRNSTSSSSPHNPASPGNTSSGGTSSNDGASIHQPDPRFNNLAIVVKSGKDVVDKRFPAQYNSFLRGIKNFILVGDANLENVAGTPVAMHDVVHGVVDKAKANLAARGSPNAPSPLLEKRRIEDTQGWKDDAVKFLPAIGLLHRTFPDADWYIIADDDIYFFTENLHHTLSKFNPTDEHYLGIPTLFVGCDGVQKFGEGPAFAHGGSGILMSKAAVAKALTVLDNCIVKYHTCWAGDITVALCMRDVGIKATLPLEYQLHQVPPTLTEFRYPHNPCIRPITFHHLKPDVMAQVHLATQVARARLQDMEYVWDKVTHRTHAHLYHMPAGSTTPELTARTSPHYAPVHFDDLFHVFVEGRHTDPDDPIVHIGKMRNSDAYHEFVASEGAKALSECRNKCVDDKKCRSWDFNPADRKCRLMEPVPRLEDREGGITGIVKGRFTCSAYSM